VKDLATLPKARKRRLIVLRQFFRLARSRKIILADPARGLTAAAPRGFTGQTLALDQQRGLFRRWAASSDAHPHVIVTKGTKAGRAPASTAYMSHVLDPSGASPRTLRCTRLADLVSTMDPKLVAAAFGMNPGGVMIYLADHIDDGRLPG
jgi:hypothetical protein